MPIYLIKDEEYLDIQRCYEVYRKDDIRNIFDDVKDNCYQSIAISLFINSDDKNLITIKDYTTDFNNAQLSQKIKVCSVLL